MAADKIMWSVEKTCYGVEARVWVRDVTLQLMYRDEEMSSPRTWDEIQDKVRDMADFARMWWPVEVPDQSTLNALALQMTLACNEAAVAGDSRVEGLPEVRGPARRSGRSSWQN